MLIQNLQGLQGFRLYDPGAYAPGFGLIPPRLGLWARPLDGPDFSQLSLFEVILHRLFWDGKSCGERSSLTELRSGRSVDFTARNGSNLWTIVPSTIGRRLRFWMTRVSRALCTPFIPLYNFVDVNSLLK